MWLILLSVFGELCFKVLIFLKISFFRKSICFFFVEGVIVFLFNINFKYIKSNYKDVFVNLFW